MIRAVLERGQYIESANATARSVCNFAVHRDDDGGPMKGIDELRSDYADDAAMPAVAGNHENAARPNRRVGLDNFFCAGKDRRFLLLAAAVLAIKLPRQLLRFCSHRFVRREQQAGGD